MAKFKTRGSSRPLKGTPAGISMTAGPKPSLPKRTMGRSVKIANRGPDQRAAKGMKKKGK